MFICRFKRIWRRTHLVSRKTEDDDNSDLAFFLLFWTLSGFLPLLLFLLFYSLASGSEGQGTTTMEAGCCWVFLASVRLFLCYRLPMLPSSPSCLPLFLFILPVLFFSLSVSSFSLALEPAACSCKRR